MSALVRSSANPFLFQRRVLVSPTLAAQYVGTDTEIDVKEPSRNTLPKHVNVSAG
jgi:hypothetical protein